MLKSISRKGIAVLLASTFTWVSGCGLETGNFNSVTCGTQTGDIVKVDVSTERKAYSLLKVGSEDGNFVTLWENEDLVAKIEFGDMADAAAKIDAVQNNPDYILELGGSNGNTFIYIGTKGLYDYACVTYSWNEELAILVTTDAGEQNLMDLMSFLYFYPAGSRRPREEWDLPEKIGGAENVQSTEELLDAEEVEGTESVVDTELEEGTEELEDTIEETESVTEDSTESERLSKKEPTTVDGDRRDEAGESFSYQIGYHVPAGTYIVRDISGSGYVKLTNEDGDVRSYYVGDASNAKAEDEKIGEGDEIVLEKGEHMRIDSGLAFSLN